LVILNDSEDGSEDLEGRVRGAIECPSAKSRARPSTNLAQPAGCRPSPQMHAEVNWKRMDLLVGPLTTNGHCGSSAPAPTEAIGGVPREKRIAAHSGWSWSQM